MIDLLEQHRDAIADLCRKHHVRRLDVFGSASTGAFDPVRSDFDFLITMEDVDAATYADRYLTFWDEIEALLGRPVDLVTEQYISNPYFKRSVELSRNTLYAA